MRIHRLELRAFGPFTDCSISLCPGLNILYGPNEAGKSSALRAIRSLLYGIHVQSADNFLHPYDKLRLAAKLTRNDGQTLEFCRRKGRKNTLRDAADDKALDDGVLDGYLGTVDEDFFLSVFGIDHDRLRQGGEDVVRGGGKIGELLFSAGGVGDLRVRQQEIESELNELFKPGGQKPTINKNLSELHRLRSEVKRLQASSEAWTAHDQELGRVVSRRAQLDEELRDKKSARSRLYRIQTALPSLGQWKTESDELLTLTDAALLPSTFASQLHEALRRLNLSQGREADARTEVAKLTKDLEGETVPEDLLAKADTIQELHLRLGSHRKAVRDRAALVMGRQGAEHTAREVLRRMGRSDALDGIEQHRIPDDKHAQVQSLGNRYEGLLERHRSAKKLRDRLQRDLTAEEVRFSESEAPVDFSDLRKVLKSVQTESRIEEESNERQQHVDQLTAEAKLALRRLPLSSGHLTDLQQLPVPSLETVEAFDEELRNLQNEESALEARVRQVNVDVDQLKQEQTEFEKGDEVPTESELLQLREKRDHGWSLILAEWKQMPSVGEDIQQFIDYFRPAEDLATAFVASIQRADAVADRLRREADRVAVKFQLESRINAAMERLAELDHEREEYEQNKKTHLDNWNDRWLASSISPLTPREMRAWLSQFQTILELGNDLQKERFAIDRLRTLAQSVRNKLVASLQAVATNDLDDKSLLELVDLAQCRVDELQAVASCHEQLSSNVVRLRQELAHAEEELQEAEENLRTWKSEWTQCMKLLQLEDDATTEQANSVLGNLTALFQAYNEAKTFRVRIDGIDKDARSFAEDVITVTTQLDPDLTARPAEEAAAELHARTLKAREIRQRVDSLREQLAEQQRKLDYAQKSISETNAELAAMCAEAGCGRVEDLAEANERSIRKRTLQESLASLENQLRLLSGGRSIGHFAEEAASEDADQLPLQIDELDRASAALEDERDQLLQAEQRIKDELQKIDGNAEAARQAAECEFLVAQLEQDVREYVVLRIASAVLKSAVDRYRKKAEGPIVARASQVFAALTRIIQWFTYGF